jgi:hypothetical protein
MSKSQWKQFLDLYAEKNQHLSRKQVLQQARKPFQQLKEYFQCGGELTEVQKQTLKNKVLEKVEETKKEFDENAPPPLPRGMMPSFNTQQLKITLENTDEGVLVKGEITHEFAKKTFKVYGIKLNGTCYAIIVEDGNFDDPYSIITI